MRFLVVSLLSLAAAATAGSFNCQSGAYPWCIHLPASVSTSKDSEVKGKGTTTDSAQKSKSTSSKRAAGGKLWPTIVFLPSSGARGSLSEAPSLATYAGPGKLISQYNSGSKSESAVLAAEDFIVVVPVAPSDDLHFDPDKIRSVISAAVAKYPIDRDHIVLSGYSMGARGTWRNLIFNGDLFSAGIPVAGGAEAAGSHYLQLQPATPTFPLLKNVVGVPIKAFAGSADQTHPAAEMEKTQSQLEKLGDHSSSLTVYSGADHSAMGMKPWTDASLLKWALGQSRSGRLRRRYAPRPS